MASKLCGEINKIRREMEENVYILQPVRSQSGWIVSLALSHLNGGLAPYLHGEKFLNVNEENFN